MGQAAAPLIPNLISNPVWSLKPWPVQVSFGDFTVEIPAHPATWWLSILMDPDMEFMDLFPDSLEPEEQEAVWDLFIDGSMADVDLAHLVLDIVATASGRPWWVAMRLIAFMQDRWASFGAELLYRGVDSNRLSLSAWLDVALLVIMKNLKKEDATMFSLQLENPPPEERASEPEPTMTSDAFLAMG